MVRSRRTLGKFFLPECESFESSLTSANELTPPHVPDSSTLLAMGMTVETSAVIHSLGGDQPLHDCGPHEQLQQPPAVPVTASFPRHSTDTPAPATVPMAPLAA